MPPGFPVTLSQGGSYKLASDLAPGAGVDGISVEDHFTTIDLNGFQIVGAQQALNGIVGLTALTVKNGTISGFGESGTAGGSYMLVENMTIAGNEIGIDTSGQITGCVGFVTTCRILLSR